MFSNCTFIVSLIFSQFVNGKNKKVFTLSLSSICYHAVSGAFVERYRLETFGF